MVTKRVVAGAKTNSGEALRLEGIRKEFDATIAVADLSLAVRHGEFVSLLGPSGCGKTTVLRCVAGYILPEQGRIFLNGQDITTTPPYRRDIGMVFQNYALFPHMTVAQNVAFGLRMRRLPGDEIRARVAETLRLVDLQGLERRHPGQLSGGQQQRVALARAIVIHPSLLLLDEPLSNLDAKLRKGMQIELRALQESLGITTVLVTHDQNEALSLSDRVIVLDRGRVQQVGTPFDIYAGPQSTFVADFIGESNLLKGRVVSRASSETMVRLESGEQLLVAGLGRAAETQDVVAVLARPEAIDVRAEPSPAAIENEFPATIVRRIYQGASETILVRLDSGLMLAAKRPVAASQATLAVGRRVHLHLSPRSLKLLLH